MKIHFEKGLQLEKAQLICHWSNALGESFQKQWMGPMIPFPLT
ncbi:MAG: GNAT family acetyltransferase, partial [Streptococcus parasanguinis DORA_23_24]